MDKETKEFFEAGMKAVAESITGTFQKELQIQLEAATGTLRKEMTAQSTELRQEMAAQSVEITGTLRKEMTAQSTELRQEMAAQSVEITGTLRKEMAVQFEDITDVIRSVAVTLDSKIGGLDSRMDKMEEELHETRTAVLRIEHVLQDKQEAQGDLIQDTRQRVERIEDHLHLPHSLSATA